MDLTHVLVCSAFASTIGIGIATGCSGGTAAQDPDPRRDTGTTVAQDSEPPLDDTAAPVEDAPPVVDTSTPKPPASCTGLAAQPKDATWKIAVSGVDRELDVHVPASYDPTKPTPIVLDFHGFTSDKGQQKILSRMIAKSDDAGFIAIHPLGTGVSRSWNAGACCGTAASEGTNDVAFVSAILDEAARRLCVDPKRVFATGMSNGGFMSHRLGCELSDRIAAIAPVAGVLGIKECAPKRPVPVMHFHGTADTLVPYEGNGAMGFPPVVATAEAWAKRNGCSGSPSTTFEKGDTVCRTWSVCKDGASVTLCTVDGGGHTWPGGFPVPGAKTTNAISATDAMWTFFEGHPMP